MVSARYAPHAPSILDSDQRVLMHGMSWRHFEAMLALRGDAPVPRMAYLDGTIELMSPSRKHETKKTLLGMLVEAYVLEKRIRFVPMGSTTPKSKLVERVAEPDESYALDPSADVPDLAIEVVLSSGGLNKLEIYQKLGVREVWFWDEDSLQAFALRGDAYQPIESSVVLRGLAVAELGRYAKQADAMEAVLAFRETLRSPAKRRPPRAKPLLPRKKRSR